MCTILVYKISTMTTATEFLKKKGLVKEGFHDMEVVMDHGHGDSYSLVALLEEYHKLRVMERYNTNLGGNEDVIDTKQRGQ
jgi:hypothetical protein